MNDAILATLSVLIMCEAVAISYIIFKIVKAYTDFLNSQGVADE